MMASTSRQLDCFAGKWDIAVNNLSGEVFGINIIYFTYISKFLLKKADSRVE